MDTLGVPVFLQGGGNASWSGRLSGFLVQSLKTWDSARGGVGREDAMLHVHKINSQNLNIRNINELSFYN